MWCGAVISRRLKYRRSVCHPVGVSANSGCSPNKVSFVEGLAVFFASSWNPNPFLNSKLQRRGSMDAHKLYGVAPRLPSSKFGDALFIPREKDWRHFPVQSYTEVHLFHISISGSVRSTYLQLILDTCAATAAATLC